MDIIITIISLLLLSAFFSASEMAFVASNKTKLQIDTRKQSISGKSAYYYSTHPGEFFSLILLVNNGANIAFASISTYFLTTWFHLSGFSVLLISTFTLLIIGELIPKYVARENPDNLILVCSFPLRVLGLFFYPIVKPISLLSQVVLRPENASEDKMAGLFAKEDIEELVQESMEAGKVDESDSDVIKKVIELGDQKVYEAMTPRTDICGIEIDSEISDIIKLFAESGYSKVPVYEENIDNIKGIVFAYDMFKSPKDLRSIMRAVIFVPDTKKSIDLLNEFLDRHISIAIVVDEFGGTAGIVTIEDILEELFGEIRDEYDTDDDLCKKIDESTYIISGKVEIDYINEGFGLNLSEGDYETLSGYITSRIGRIPKVKEKFEIEGRHFTVLKSDERKVSLVKLSLDLDSFEEI